MRFAIAFFEFLRNPMILSDLIKKILEEDLSYRNLLYNSFFKEICNYSPLPPLKKIGHVCVPDLFLKEGGGE